MSVSRNCPSCEGSRQKSLDQYSRPPWNIVQCDDCQFVYLANPVDYSELEKNYAWEKSIKTEWEYRQKDRPLVDGFSKATRWRLHLLKRDRQNYMRSIFKQGRILDIGCGGGSRLPTPLIPFGVEISEFLADQADSKMRERGGYCINAPAVEGVEQFPSNFFNGVLLRSFLEHETQPLRLIKGMHRILEENGRAYIRVPNFSSVNRRVMGSKWCGFRFPDHVNYFTKNSLTEMAESAGFRVKILNWANLPFDDNIKMLLVKSPE